MKVLHVTNAWPYPEVPEYGVFVKEQVAALGRAGLSCDVLFINARREGKVAYLKAVARLRRMAPGYDVIHCHHVYSAYVAALARVRQPVAVSFQNDWPHEVEIGNRALQVLGCRIGAWYGDRVIFKSPVPPQFRGQDRFVHLPNGVNFDVFAITCREEARRRLGLDAGAVYVLFVSSKDQFRPQKRYDRFAQVMEQVRARHPAMDLRELVMVNQPRERVSDFFNAADLHLLCSDFEGSPNSVKEALCTGLPVVATPVGNTPQMIAGVPGCHGASGFGVEELSELTACALADRPARQAVREAFIAKGLGQDAVTRKLQAIYAQLCQGA